MKKFCLLMIMMATLSTCGQMISMSSSVKKIAQQCEVSP